MEARFVSRTSFFDLLGRLHEKYSVLLPVTTGGSPSFRRYAAPLGEGVSVGGVRTSEPAKALYFRARAKVAEDFRDEVPAADGKPLCVVGVKACDLKGFKILDSVFAGADYRDPSYVQAREENLILSADCTSALDTCFCLALQVQPYPSEGFDLNLSEVEGGFLAETGSAKGEALLGEHGSLFQQATADQRRARDAQREQVRGAVEKNLREFKVPVQEQLAGVIQKAYDAPLWKQEAETCVECGACNTICPTCHCFLLFDQADDRNLVRYRLWDSCLIKDFATVAGGANPRPQLWMRLRNRFEKKFDFFPRVNDLFACTGCGRCVLACPGKIDIREVLRRNVEYVRA